MDFLRGAEKIFNLHQHKEIDFDREAQKFFTVPHSFRESVHYDVDSTFFGLEFADYNDINGAKVLSIIVNNSSGVTIPDSEEKDIQGIMRSQVILYCRHDDISGLMKDQSVKLNGKLYTVKEFHEINNYVWRILLERNENE